MQYRAMDKQGKARDFGTALLGAADIWRAEFRHLLAQRGFNAAGGDILACLESGELSQSHLTVRMGLSKQAVQQALDGLEASGHVRRENDPLDRRAKRVILTELGLRALAEHRAAAVELEQRYSDRLGRKAFKKLRKVLRELGRDLPLDG
jgi:DNA-binding MarR family transcriptional regulator